MRPLEKLPSIRVKLGAVIVLAVAMTLLVSYVAIGFALRNSPRDSEAIDALSLARQAAIGQLTNVPGDTEIMWRDAKGNVTSTDGQQFSFNPPVIEDHVPRWGVVGNITWATVPLDNGGTVTAMQPAFRRGPLGRVSATLGFLQSVWWQFLLAGAVARARHDPAAARHGRGGAPDGGGRLHVARPHAQPRRGRTARERIQPDERRAGAPRAVPA
jgi:hypothetical protein